MNKNKLAELQGTMKGLKFGIEIETVGISRTLIAQTVSGLFAGSVISESRNIRGDVSYKVTMTDGRSWTIVPDRSLSTYQSGEITSPILGYADLDDLQKVVRAVRAAGARADHSCGIHIHVDGSSFTAKSIKALVRLVHNREAMVEAALRIRNSHRRQRYCSPVSATFAERIRRAGSMDTINRLWYGTLTRSPSRYDHTRYAGVNLNSLFYRGTIEFRWFNGTLHAGEIKAYVQLVLAFSARSLTCSNVWGKKEYDQDTVRAFTGGMLRRLGLVGDEFKNTRQHLTKHLPKAARAPRTPNLADTIARERRQMDAAGGTAHVHAAGCCDHAAAQEAANNRIARANARTDAECAQVLRTEQVGPTARDIAAALDVQRTSGTAAAVRAMEASRVRA